MGTCESLFNNEKNNKENNKVNKTNKVNQINQVNQPKNRGSNLFCAPVDSTNANNDNTYVNQTMSQMTIDVSQYREPQKPRIYQYINKYKTNGLQKSIAKASLVEMGQQNSLIYSNIKNSKANQTNSLYTSRADDTGYESSYDGFEMIVDGKMDEEMVKQSTDKNTLNNYNEFIRKKDDNNLFKNKNTKVMDYYHKPYLNNNNKKLDSILEENKDADSDLSGIPKSSPNKIKNNNNKMKIPGKY